MIRFLLKGIFRDRSRSLLPALVVATGVMLTVFMHAYVTGIMGDTIEMTARFTTGHVKVMSKAYAENSDLRPNDLALMEVGSLLEELRTTYPDMYWAERIQFGGLIDAPDENGETRSQGPAVGMGLDLLSSQSMEDERLNLTESLVRGKMPSEPGEVLLSEEFSRKLKVDPGDPVTLIGSSMHGSMIMYNFIVSGTLSFGTDVLDRGTLVADIEDVRLALDMYDAAGELTGFFKGGYYNDEKAVAISGEFTEKYLDEEDEYAPLMKPLRDQENMTMYLDLSQSLGVIVTLIFMFAMSLVLWNAGLLGGIRRYGEIGLRLAIGEEKRHVYWSMILESIMIGIVGSILGTALGLFFAWLLETYGLDIGSLMKGSSVMMPSVVRAHITTADFYIGFIPGVISTVIGTALAAIGIYKRKTAQLFKELEV